MPLLIITSDDPRLFRRFLIEEDRFTIGRSRASSLSIRDRSVSKTHLQVERTPQGYAFRDLSSSNGTYLNDERRQNGILRDGDVIRLGRVEITFKELGTATDFPANGAGPGAGAAAGGAAGGAAAAGTAGGRVPVSRQPPADSQPQAGAASASRQPPADSQPQAGAASASRQPPADSQPPAVLFPVREADARWRRPLISLGIGVLGIGLGILAGQIGSLFSPSVPPGAGAMDSAPAAGVAKDPAESRAVASRQVDEPREVTSSPLVDLDPPYADPDESARVLFRLFLDVLGRPPTRGEAKEMLSLGHRERWQRLRLLRKDSAPPPAVESASEPDPVITAGREYRAASRRRQRTGRQWASSLLVDLLDRPPASDGEVRDVERALEEDAGAAVRTLAYSKDGTAALPRFPAAGDEAAARAWIAGEFRRFLSREPSMPELTAVLAELGRGEEGARQIRIALAGSREYRSY